MGRIPAAAKRKALLWLSLGISPRRLALTLALGFAVGCIPVIGIPTVLCAGLALALRLNQPAIQAANYAAMPLQFALIVPFVRLGGWITSSPVSAKSTSFLVPRRARSLVGCQPCLPHERNRRPGVAGLACSCHPGSPADDFGIQSAAPPHSRSESAEAGD